MTGSRPTDWLAGLELLVRGLGLVLRRGRLFGLGLVPPLITSVVFLTAFVTLLWQAPGLAVLLTPFAEGWAGAEALRGFTAAAVVVAVGLILVLMFTSTTLALGAPLYDKISEAVDAEAGTLLSQPEPGLLEGLGVTLRRIALTVAITVPVGLGLLLVGLIPAAGPALAGIASVLFGGWMVALDLIGSAADRRGYRTLAARQELVGRNRWLSLGFGVPAFLLMSLPFVGVVAFPVATAGGTLLVRRLTGQRS